MPIPFSFPTYTLIGDPPTTYCEELNPTVFQYPFLNQGIAAIRKPYADRKTSMLGVNPLPQEGQLLPIKGFIYHTAHCGSTLLGRILGSSSQVRMISEPESINGLLLSYVFHQLPEEQVIIQLRQILEAYRIPGDGKTAIIFKLTSWNVFFIDLFQKTYPEINWIYIDRETEELVQILKNEDGGFIDWWQHPVDALRKYFVRESSRCTNLESYLNEMVEGHRASAFTGKNEKSLFVQYPDFLANIPAILAHFNLKFGPTEMEKALSFLQFESKVYEQTPFQS